MVELIDQLFEALHQIIISFFFKLAIFAPALVNAVLVGFGIGSFANAKWGIVAGLIAGVVAAIAMEAASIIASFNLDAQKVTSYILPVLYIAGSWIVVWFGLPGDWQIEIIGFVMPIFAISLPAVIAGRKRLQNDLKLELQKQELEHKQQEEITKREAEKTRQLQEQIKLEQEHTEQEQERTKQERAKARGVKASNLASSRVKKEDALQWLTERPDISPSLAAQELGVSRQTIYNWRDEIALISHNNNHNNETN